MKRLYIILLVFCGLLQAAEEPVSVTLSGTVQDGDGNALEGVTVSLVKMDELSMVTGADGAFTLTNVTSVLHAETVRGAFEFGMRNNSIVFFTVSEKITGEMFLHSGAGRVITSVNLDNLHVGQRHVTLPELSSGIYLLTGTINGESFSRALISVGNKLYLKNKTTAAGNRRALALGKYKASEEIDTLIAVKEGYDTTRYPIDGYTQDNITIVMTEAGQGGEFTITSTAFDEGDEMPDEYTCEGKSFTGMIAPPLEWSGIPTEAKSLALFFKDLTIAASAQPRNGYHWGMWNIPITVTGMPEGLGGDAKPAEMDGAEQKSAVAAMAGGSNKFFGPCPSMGTRTTDTYAFILYAFDTEVVSPPADLVEMDKYFEENAIAQTSISVTSDAKAQ